MVRRSRGPRVSTRYKLQKKPRERGLSPITRSLQQFNVGEKASIVIDPSYHKGQPHPRFHGLTGIITGKQGNTYKLDVKVGSKIKTLLVRSEHLKKIKSQPA